MLPSQESDKQDWLNLAASPVSSCVSSLFARPPLFLFSFLFFNCSLSVEEILPYAGPLSGPGWLYLCDVCWVRSSVALSSCTSYWESIDQIGAPWFGACFIWFLTRIHHRWYTYHLAVSPCDIKSRRCIWPIPYKVPVSVLPAGGPCYWCSCLGLIRAYRMVTCKICGASSLI